MQVKEVIMKNKMDTATSKFLEGYNCAQSVLYVFCDDLGLDRDLALKTACGFGAGMGRKEEVCGAVTGGIMVLGAKYGRGEKDPRAITDLMYQKVRGLMDRFAGKHGTFICRGLLGQCELTTEEGQRVFREKDLLNNVCMPCVQSVVEILESIIQTSS
jgi:C_GCAxxG_C_C family probable redox protein